MATKGYMKNVLPAFDHYAISLVTPSSKTKKNDSFDLLKNRPVYSALSVATTFCVTRARAMDLFVLPLVRRINFIGAIDCACSSLNGLHGSPRAVKVVHSVLKACGEMTSGAPGGI